MPWPRGVGLQTMIPVAFVVCLSMLAVPSAKFPVSVTVRWLCFYAYTHIDTLEFRQVLYWLCIPTEYYEELNDRSLWIFWPRLSPFYWFVNLTKDQAKRTIYSHWCKTDHISIILFSVKELNIVVLGTLSF